MTRKRALVMMAGLVIAILCGFFGWNEKFRMEAKNGPESTIGKSGDFKSPGGTPEESERRRI
ncbi:hypothetical protein [Bradyrhizobium sp. JYMT SZCCT0428]|uniref:hypothetical protein n=1 Tax=Bradyrhizobium sp. JYMT SZCCT0428 TaxID=2807673 RepID=UPI001BA8CDA8|nr:hypothetical protein [Bradyrhizobium sp. JYMT SZCCT0428]MBR1156220.1 hypothetical protein [Bradyrhizobium sp. JYMT SZCCT0428]